MKIFNNICQEPFPDFVLLTGITVGIIEATLRTGPGNGRRGPDAKVKTAIDMAAVIVK